MNEKQDAMESLNMDHFPRRPPINIAFKDIRYKVVSWQTVPPRRKEILHGIGGEFRSGELTAIMGPSGAGKSTLLNILAGFAVKGSSGKILINGESRNIIGLEEFKKVSCYIQQEDVVRPLLSVYEAMSLATHLKLGCGVSSKEKHAKIMEILGMLSLHEHKITMCGRLSGGQKKRLSIALELITNPPVIFLDEPTTGLDSVSTTACVSLMKRLARQGRTMICTLHQPSAKIFEQFSQLYCVAQGVSIYQGPPENVASFMANFELLCPPYHNPADFIIEIAAGDYPRELHMLSEAAEKAGQDYAITSWNTDKSTDKGLEMFNLAVTDKKTNLSSSDLGGVQTCLPKPASGWIQLFHLYYRNVLILRRDVLNVVLRFAAHIFISVIFGYLYQNVGNNSETLLANFIFVYGTNLFLHYTGQMTVLLSFPLEYEVLTREHFNRWYTLPPYCLSLLLIELPLQAICALLYIIFGYYLTGQPLEWSRFLGFVMFNQAISVAAQGTGFLAGALLPVTIAVFLAPVFSVFFSVFGFTSKYTDITAPLRPLYNASYFRSAFQGSFLALYGNNRSDLPCHSDEIYCHYKKPEKFLKEMGFWEFQNIPEVSYILAIGFFAYAMTALTVWFKLNKR